MPATPSQQTRFSIEELCTRHENENVHTAHVTALALRLFDETRARLGLSAADRPLLEAAARLHDVGYASDPRRHPDVSAEIVLREGLAGFRETQQDYIAAVIPFHSGKRKPTDSHPLLETVHDPKRVLRLAAILRVADALDHSHLQDATIAAVRSGKKTIQVRVRCAHFPYNLEVADRKADLWRAVFPVGIRFVRVPQKEAPSLIGPELHPVEAARRLLFLQVRIVTKNVEGALEGNDSEPLHDIRVAIRRFRVLLRAFRKPLAATSAQRLDAELERLNTALGPPRDLDVWVDFLSSAAVKKSLGRHRGWERFIAHQRELRRLQMVTVRRHLGRAAFARLRERLGVLLRLELPRLIRAEPPASMEKLARNALWKAFRRARKLAGLRHSQSPEDLHRLRIALRRLRYYGVFFSPVLGPPVGKFTKRVHAVEQTFGRIHDADVALGRVLREGPAPPRLLVRSLEGRRQEAIAELGRAWERLRNPKLQREVRRRLKA
jgi:CHAD domain-containing protein